MKTRLAMLAAAACLAVAACRDVAPQAVAPSPNDATRVEAEPTPQGSVIAARPFDGGTLRLHAGPDAAQLWWSPAEGPARSIACDRLVGAWGLWTDDVDGDGHVEILVALRKRAKFDDKLDNRLHVYGVEQGQCVPAWRGTRLAGRFEALRVDPDAPGTIVVSERLGPTRRRVARYRWNDFGYRVDDVLWQGTTEPPAALLRGLDSAPS